jgi:PAS domain S-box-containing protein/putative nucleotidyltransferase with HDIG domain
VIASWVLLSGAIVGLQIITDGRASDALFVFCVLLTALCATRFGIRGGLISAGAAISFLSFHDVIAGAADLGVLGIVARDSACLFVGVFVGRFMDERAVMADAVEQHFVLSHDLFCTVSLDGYFEELNPAWERTLGYTDRELWSKPFLDFVHPDDKEATEAETRRLSEGVATVSFRNRYRAANGGYRWLEWNVQPHSEKRKLFATARDIAAQMGAEQILQEQSGRLEQTVRKRTQELKESRLEVIKRLAVAGEYRDDDTHEHTERVGRAAARIARKMGLPREDVELIRRAAPLHDIGKVGIPDGLLRKPGKLTADEYEFVQEHVEIGAKILSHGRFSVLHVARTIALSHHERWDGSGYPYGLARGDIPLVGRIAAVADVFDALTHARPYKPAWTVAAAVAEIERGADAQFGPDVVQAFLALDHSRLLHPVGGLRHQQSKLAPDSGMRQTQLAGPLRAEPRDPAQAFAHTRRVTSEVVEHA